MRKFKCENQLPNANCENQNFKLNIYHRQLVIQKNWSGEQAGTPAHNSIAEKCDDTRKYHNILRSADGCRLWTCMIFLQTIGLLRKFRHVDSAKSCPLSYFWNKSKIKLPWFWYPFLFVCFIGNTTYLRKEKIRASCVNHNYEVRGTYCTSSTGGKQSIISLRKESTERWFAKIVLAWIKGRLSEGDKRWGRKLKRREEK